MRSSLSLKNIVEVLINPAGKAAHAATLDIHPARSTQTRYKTFATEKELEGYRLADLVSQLVRGEHVTAIDDVFIFHVSLLDATVACNPTRRDRSPSSEEAFATDKAGQAAHPKLRSTVGSQATNAPG